MPDTAHSATPERRQHFIDSYAAAYLAAEASRATAFAEQHGTAHSYGRSQPVEDAYFLACCAWEQAVATGAAARKPSL